MPPVASPVSEISAIDALALSQRGSAQGQDDLSRTAAKIKLLNDWRCMAHNYKWLHIHSSRLFQKRNIFIAIPVIAMSTMTGALTLIVGCNADVEMRYALGFMSLAAAALSTAHNILKYGERASSHKSSADGFDELSREIALETVIHDSTEKTYANLTEFIKMCNDRMTRLVEQAPSIPDTVLIKVLKPEANKELPRSIRELSTTLQRVRLAEPAADQGITVVIGEARAQQQT